VDDRDLVRYFAELATRLMAAREVHATRRVIVDAAVEVIDACDHASISHMRGRSLVSASSSDDVGLVLDGIQTGADEGPCLDSIRSGEVIGVDELATDPRFPTYGPRAVESAGVHSSLAQPLREGDRVVGALNLFGSEPGGFRDDATDDVALAAILAAHAAPALVAALHRENMARALETRDLIGQAKGMLMARTGVDEEAAFTLLVRASQRMQLKLAEVARRIVDGTLVEDA
jgi:GAF domain-containing protein